MAKIIHFPRWLEVLDASNLSSEIRESFKVTLRWYLAWCSRQSLACSVSAKLSNVSSTTLKCNYLRCQIRVHGGRFILSFLI